MLIEKRTIILFLSACVLGIVLTPATGFSVTFTVNSTADAVDANPGDGACATAGSVCTLRAAIQEANALAGNNVITLPTGTYTLTITGTGEDAAATGDLDITSNITINGAGPANTIIDGGGLDRVFDMFAPATVSISGVTIRNGVTGSGGGGINNAGSLTLTDCIITGNSDNCGGGIANISTGSLTIINSTISNNNAYYGAGICNAGSATITNSTISGNTANISGGGIFHSSTSPLTLINTTITNNTADNDNNGTGDGGGIFNSSGAVNLKNTIIAGNTDKGGQAPDCSGTLTSQDFNLIQSAAGCTISGTTTHNITGQDPKLGALAGNGGPTQTHVLLPGSPAIDAGTNTGCPSTDQRGVSRPQDGNGDGTTTCDIGAYEVVLNISVAPLSVAFGSVTTGITSDQTVTVANTGASSLVIGTIAGTDPLAAPFTITVNNCSGQTIAPAGNCTLTVHFAPTSAGSFNDTFNIPSNDPYLPTATVSVNGIGTTNNPPSAPELIFPPNGQAGLGTSVTFRWKKTTDPDGDTVAYKLSYCADQSFAGCTPVDVASLSAKYVYYAGFGWMWLLLIGMVFAGSVKGRKRMALLIIVVVMLTGGILASCGGGGGSGTPADEMSYTASGLNSGAAYYWKVVADDGKGGTTESAVWSFTTQ